MKELSKRSDDLSFHVPAHPMFLVVSPPTASINGQINSCERLGLKCCKLGLSLKLYPGNMQRMLNKDLTRFMQSLSRERQYRAGKRRLSYRVGLSPTINLVNLIWMTRPREKTMD